MLVSNKTYYPLFPLFFLNEFANDFKNKILDNVLGLSSFQNSSVNLNYSFTFFKQNPLDTYSYKIISDRMSNDYFRPLFYGELSLDKYEYRVTKTSFETDDYDCQIVGCQYFGARYYNSDISVWLSVDPMSDKYPSLSPYNYCAGNPVMLVDPDGRSFGDYYTRAGKWLGSDRNTNDNKVYFATSKSVTTIENEDGTTTEQVTFNNAEELSVSHDEFRKQASTIYGESSAYLMNNVTGELVKEMFAMATVHQENDKAYGANSDKALEYLAMSPEEINGDNFKTIANSAVMNALLGGPDLSNGADMWDGAAQASYSESFTGCCIDGYELHMNTMGWSIADPHYAKWKKNVGKGFQAPQTRQATSAYNGVDNTGEIHLYSTAVYCNTIFWKEK